MSNITQEQTDNLIEKIKPYGIQIGKDRLNGNKLALNIISYYRLFEKCPEAGAFGLLEMAFEDWVKENSSQ